MCAWVYCRVAKPKVVFCSGRTSIFAATRAPTWLYRCFPWYVFLCTYYLESFILLAKLKNIPTSILLRCFPKDFSIGPVAHIATPWSACTLAFLATRSRLLDLGKYFSSTRTCFWRWSVSNLWQVSGAVPRNTVSLNDLAYYADSSIFSNRV